MMNSVSRIMFASTAPVPSQAPQANEPLTLGVEDLFVPGNTELSDGLLTQIPEADVASLQHKVSEASQGALVNYYDHITDPRVTYLSESERTALIAASHQRAKEVGVNLHLTGNGASFEDRQKRLARGSEDFDPVVSDEASLLFNNACKGAQVIAQSAVQLVKSAVAPIFSRFQ